MNPLLIVISVILALNVPIILGFVVMDIYKLSTTPKKEADHVD